MATKYTVQPQHHGHRWYLSTVTSPDLGDVQEAVDAFDVHEKTVIGHGGNSARAELIRVGALKVRHVLDGGDRRRPWSLSLSVGEEAHVDAAERRVHLFLVCKGTCYVYRGWEKGEAICAFSLLRKKAK